MFLDLWWDDCSPADGRWLECFLLWWSWWSGELKWVLPLLPYKSSLFPVIWGTMCICTTCVSSVHQHSADASLSSSPTQSQWESCGWDCCVFTLKNLTSKSMSSASAKGNASPPLRSSGPANALQLKVLTPICLSFCLCLGTGLSFLLTHLIFSSDPFDLNHNLGAGVSRKSKCFSLTYPTESVCHSDI